MGFLDDITKIVGEKLSGGTGGGLIEQAMGLVNDPRTGGLAGLVEMFKNKGLGDAVSSWIGTGDNQQVSSDQIASAVGSDTLQEIARKLGMSGQDTSNGLAELLPQIIDKLTPEGTVPEGDLLEQGLSLLKQKLFG